MKKLNKGEYYCSKCNGEGIIPDTTKIIKADLTSLTYVSGICKKCEGKGKVDWVENVLK